MSNTSGGSPTDKKLRAIDMLDQHIIKRSKGANRLASPPSVLPWMNTHLPPPSPQRQSNDIDESSPTPKRRKLHNETSPIKEVNAIEQQKLSILSHTKTDISANASPSIKSVAFSDNVESSPTQVSLGSSPRPSSTSKPSKSILRNPTRIKKTVSDLTYNKGRSPIIANSLVSIENSFNGIDPRTLDYWVNGEVHKLFDFNNVIEFKSILEGGLELLGKPEDCYIARRFEIYATFNNIMPVIPSRNVTEVCERKVNIVIDNLENILAICLPHMQSEQNKLLSTNDKKNPFVSRIYVQIVRFFGSILSNFKIMRFLTKRPQLQLEFKDVYKYSNEALRNPNSNKVIIAAQIAFMAEEKFGTYFLKQDEIENIILTVAGVREIQSTNLVCEKLLLIKKFLAKYPRIMIENISKWLPGEVLTRIFIHEEIYSLKILVTAIVILLDLLKKCLDISEGHEEIYKFVEILTIKDVVPEKFFSQICKEENQQYGSLTLGELLRRQIKNLITVKHEYKLAMDLWLAMTGLMYNNPQKILEMGKKGGHSWIELNHLCFQVENPQAKLLSLKVWRILIYCVCSHLEDNSDVQNTSLADLLQKPFLYGRTEHSDPNVREGLIYYLSGIIYTFCGLSKSLSGIRFIHFWDELIEPIYVKYIFPSKSVQFKTRAITLLLRLIGGKTEEQTESSSKREGHLIRVIASVGVGLKDIQPLAPSTVKLCYKSIMTIVFGAIRSDVHNVTLNYELINTLLKQLPAKLDERDLFKSFGYIIFEVLSEAQNAKNFSDLVCQYYCALAQPFAELLFKGHDEFNDYITVIDHLVQDDSEIKVRLLKDILKETRGQISEMYVIENFLKTRDEPSKSYISNWIGSTLLSPDISSDAFQSLVNIVKLAPTASVMENFLTLCSKTNFNVDLCSMLDVASWVDESFVLFVRIFVSKMHDEGDNTLEVILKEVLPQREIPFIQLLPHLVQLKYYDVVKSTIDKSPTFVNHISVAYLPHLSNILPTNRMQFFMENLLAYHRDVQVTILRWLLYKNEIDLIFEKFEILNECLFGANIAPNELTERNYFTTELLEKVYVKKMWNYISKMIELCMGNSQSACIITLFAGVVPATLTELNPKALACMVNKCGSINSLILESIKKSYQGSHIDYNLQLTRCLIDLEKLQIFFLYRNEFFIFFTDKADTFTPMQQKSAENIFQMFANSLMNHSGKFILEFVSDFLSYLPQVSTPYLSQLVSSFTEHSKFTPERFQDSKGYEKISKCVRNWNSQKLPVNQGESESEENSQKPELSTDHIKKSDDVVESTNQIQTETKDIEGSEVQVPATQSNNDIKKSQQPVVIQVDINMDKSSLENSSSMGEQVAITNKEKIKKERTRSCQDPPPYGTTSESSVALETSSSHDGAQRIEETSHTEKDTIEKDTIVSAKIVSVETEKVDDFREISNRKELPANGLKLEGTNKALRPKKTDDFAPVKVDYDDKFLNAMEKKITKKIDKSSSPSISKKNAGPPSPAQDLYDKDADESAVSNIRIPIFNSLRIYEKHAKGAHLGQKQLERAGNDSKSDAYLAMQKVPHESSYKYSEQAMSVNQNETAHLDDSKEYITSSEATPSLKIHFPSKKSRRLVNRLRGFTTSNISSLSAEEKRNLRIELLDFMMRLEHDDEM